MPNSMPAAEAAPSRRTPGHVAGSWVLAYVALLPFPGLAEAVLTLGAAFALVQLVRWRRRAGAPVLTSGAAGLTTVLFLAFWLPQAVAAVDAADPGRAWGKALGALRYLPFLWLAAIAVARGPARFRVFAGIGCIALAWTLDALLQPLLGTSPVLWLLERASLAVAAAPLCTPDDWQAVGRFNGVFSECNPKLGQVLAVLAPFALFLGVRRRAWLVLAALVGLAVLLSGSRAAWLSYALVVLASAGPVLGRRGLAVLLLGGVLALGAAAAWLPGMAERVQRTAAVLDDPATGLDQALSGRGRIWAGAACMIAGHPVNGVGVRGFRREWADCDPRPGEPAAWGEGPALHAHQLVLEILAETGVLGLLFWLAGAALAVRAWRYAAPEARQRARPAAVAIAVAVFPLNTHLAVYSAFWGGITLLLAALYAGALLARD